MSSLEFMEACTEDKELKNLLQVHTFLVWFSSGTFLVWFWSPSCTFYFGFSFGWFRYILCLVLVWFGSSTFLVWFGSGTFLYLHPIFTILLKMILLLWFLSWGFYYNTLLILMFSCSSWLCFCYWLSRQDNQTGSSNKERAVVV